MHTHSRRSTGSCGPARRTGGPWLAFHPDWAARLMMVLRRRVRWKHVVAGEHGLVYGARRYGDFAKALRTPGKTMRVFDPVGGEAPLSLGANRNLLVDNRAVDPLSGTAAFNDQFVAVRSAQRVPGE